MTTHEKTRLIELLCSGDEANILLAKEICEQQGRVDIIITSVKMLFQMAQIELKISPQKTDDFKRLVSLSKEVSKTIRQIFSMTDALTENKSILDDFVEAINNYYSKHLQSSE